MRASETTLGDKSSIARVEMGFFYFALDYFAIANSALLLSSLLLERILVEAARIFPQARRPMP
jgi:hypothetical protein